MAQTLFIADLHFTAQDRKKAVGFVQFLNDKAQTTEALYILGDCFDLWIGDDIECSHHQMVLNALRRWTERIPCYFMPGNHDFLVGNRFYKESGVQRLPDPTCVQLYGTTYLLTHGDRFICNDRSYLWFRRCIQSNLLKYIFLQLPLRWRQATACWLQKRCHQLDGKKAAAVTAISIKQLKSALTKLHATHCIHGHTHDGKLYLHENSGGWMERYALGDWNQQASYLAIDDRQIALEVYSMNR